MSIANAALGAASKATEIIAEGAKAQAAATGIQSMIALMRTKMGEHWPEVLDTPIGEAALEIAAPIMIMAMFDAFGQQIPGAQKGRMVAEYAMKGVTANKMQQLAAAAQPFMLDLISLGAGLMQQQIGPSSSSED